MKVIVPVILGFSALFLAACSSPAQRMRDCQDQGASYDTCYLAEQNRQAANAAAMNGAAEKQALENARKAFEDQSSDTSHHHKHH